MALRIRRIDWSELDRYASIPAVVPVQSVLVPQAIEGGLGGIRLTERRLTAPYEKDYDAVNPPSTWRDAHPKASWLLVLAEDGETLVGAAAALSAGGTTAELWDIRVAPASRRGGVGRALLEHVASWAASRGAMALVAETQNVNVPACRFYRAAGAGLGALDLHLYAPPVAEEVALFWRLELPPAPRTA